MKLEYLQDVNNNGDSLVRLYDFSFDETTQLIDFIKETIIEKGLEFNLEKVPFIQEINCKMILIIGKKNIGIKQLSEKNFEFKLTLDGYKKMVKYLTPFLSNENGYQWLYNENTPIDFLYSKDGLW